MSNEQSIRDELAQVIAVGDGARGYMVLADDELMADVILASPVIRRIQAEAWYKGHSAGVFDKQYGTGTRNPYTRKEQS